MKAAWAWLRKNASAVILAVIIATLNGVSLLAYAHYQDTSRAAQQRQGQQIERKLCTTLGKLAAEKPPPGDASANPSRAFEQEQHAILAALGPDIGCKG